MVVHLTIFGIISSTERPKGIRNHSRVDMTSATYFIVECDTKAILWNHH